MPLLEPFYAKLVNLPRRARDKHKEKLRRKGVFCRLIRSWTRLVIGARSSTAAEVDLQITWHLLRPITDRDSSRLQSLRRHQHQYQHLHWHRHPSLLRHRNLLRLRLQYPLHGHRLKHRLPLLLTLPRRQWHQTRTASRRACRARCPRQAMRRACST